MPIPAPAALLVYLPRAFSSPTSRIVEMMDYCRSLFLFLLNVHLLINSARSASVYVEVHLSQRHPLSPYIYGVNFASPNLLAWGVPLTRNGGNQCSKYDWKIDMTNSAEDWYFMTDKPSPSFQPPAPLNGSFVDVMMIRAVEANSVLLNPLNVIGFVVRSADKCYSFPVSVYGQQQREDGDMGNGVLRNGTLLTSDWHCFRPYGVADNVEWLKPHGGARGSQHATGPPLAADR